MATPVYLFVYASRFGAPLLQQLSTILFRRIILETLQIKRVVRIAKRLPEQWHKVRVRFCLEKTQRLAVGERSVEFLVALLDRRRTRKKSCISASKECPSLSVHSYCSTDVVFW